MLGFKDEKLQNLPKKKCTNYFENRLFEKKKKKKFARFLCTILKRFFVSIKRTPFYKK